MLSLSANLDAIQTAFQRATAELIAATANGVVGGTVTIGQQFAGNQIDQLAADVRAAAALVQQIRVTAGLITTNLSPGEFFFSILISLSSRVNNM